MRARAALPRVTARRRRPRPGSSGIAHAYYEGSYGSSTNNGITRSVFVA